MPREDLSIRTTDGECRTSVFTPNGAGPWPAVIMYMDGLAIRPTLHQMAQRIADFGYVVLLPDMFYRAGIYEPMEPQKVFAGQSKTSFGDFMGSIDTQRVVSDAAAFIAYLDSRKDVRGKRIGAHGYCMGGGLSLATAAAFPERVAAVGSFHGGGLATDDPKSPHLQFEKIKAFVYIAAADKDPYYDSAMAARTVQALMDAHLPHRHELYKDALHGWTMPDFPPHIYRREDSERHFEELRALYAQHLA